VASVFLPGWGAPATLYEPLLPGGWTALEPPTFAASSGLLDAHREWLAGELRARRSSVVAGHSMGGAIALFVAAAHPELVERLVLLSPAGLPLTKPIRASVRDFAAQALEGIYPPRTLLAGAAALVRVPRAALNLALHVRSLDLRRECARIRVHGLPALVVGCTTDSLVRADQARDLADELGADYVELDAPGGHMWMVRDRARFAAVLEG
jgi:pimeloyl-ACP methyl ester carboxylesterase